VHAVRLLMMLHVSQALMWRKEMGGIDLSPLHAEPLYVWSEVQRTCSHLNKSAWRCMDRYIHGISLRWVGDLWRKRGIWRPNFIPKVLTDVVPASRLHILPQTWPSSTFDNVSLLRPCSADRHYQCQVPIIPSRSRIRENRAAQPDM